MKGDYLVQTGSESHAVLLSRLRSGDKDALAELFVSFERRLRCMIELRLNPMLAGRASVSDIMQETYIDALNRVDHFVKNPEMPFYLWLRLIAGQRMVDDYRRHCGAEMRDVQRQVSLDQASFSASSLCLARMLACGGESPSRAAMRKEDFALLEQALNSMDPLDREVLALRHFEELSNDEAAHVLGLKKAAASNRYVRALQRLRDILATMPGLNSSPGAPTEIRS